LIMDREQNRPKGYGYVEFQDLESLTAALKLDSNFLEERRIRLDVADAKQSTQRKTWGSDRDGDHGYGDGYSKRDAEPARELPAERPKLNLVKRGASAESAHSQETEKSDSPAPAKPKFDPFGGAKPRDEKKFEEERQKKIAERRAKEASLKAAAASEIAAVEGDDTQGKTHGVPAEVAKKPESSGWERSEPRADGKGKGRGEGKGKGGKGTFEAGRGRGKGGKGDRKPFKDEESPREVKRAPARPEKKEEPKKITSKNAFDLLGDDEGSE